MKKLDKLLKIADDILPEFINFDIISDEWTNYYTIRFYNKDIDAVLRVGISEKSLKDGTAEKTVEKTARHLNNIWNSKLHRALK